MTDRFHTGHIKRGHRTMYFRFVYEPLKLYVIVLTDYKQNTIQNLDLKFLINNFKKKTIRYKPINIYLSDMFEEFFQLVSNMIHCSLHYY
jgi:hypothetical protein